MFIVVIWIQMILAHQLPINENCNRLRERLIKRIKTLVRTKRNFHENKCQMGPPTQNILDEFQLAIIKGIKMDHEGNILAPSDWSGFASVGQERHEESAYLEYSASLKQTLPIPFEHQPFAIYANQIVKGFVLKGVRSVTAVFNNDTLLRTQLLYNVNNIELLLEHVESLRQIIENIPIY